MPSVAKGVRLYLKPASGSRVSSWIIRDGNKRISTGAKENEVDKAERALDRYTHADGDPMPRPLLTSRLHQAKRRAEKAGREFNLTLEGLVAMGEAQRWRCALTGLSFDMTGDPWSRPFAPSIDRIENGGGYTPDNVRLVLHSMNCALGPWGADAFAPIARAFLDSRRAA